MVKFPSCESAIKRRKRGRRHRGVKEADGRMNCQGWSRQGQVCQGGFRLFAGAGTGRTGAAGDTAAGTLDSWLAGPPIVAGDNNPTSWHGKGKK